MATRELDADTVEAAAKIACIPQAKLRAFASLLTVAVQEAHRASQAAQPTPITRASAKRYFAKLRKLLTELETLVADMRTGKGKVAGAFLDVALAPESIETILKPKDRIGFFVQSVDRAERMANKLLPGRGGPKGLRKAPGFQLFTTQVVICVSQLGGKLTCNRQHDGTLTGKFVQMLELLSDVLPPRFVPPPRKVERAFQLAERAK